MFSKIILNKNNLLTNLKTIKGFCNNAQICAMVKANAYGHGIKEIVNILKGRVGAFGVVNIEEALKVREVDKSTPVIIFSECDNIELALKNNVSLSIISIKSLKNIIKISKKCKIKPKLHLNINTGMNRFGIKTHEDFYKIISILRKNQIQLKGLFTHFSSLTTDENYTIKQREILQSFIDLLPQDFKPIIHVGGGNSLLKEKGFEMYRVGMFLYGYGHSGLLPVMSIRSKIIALQDVKKSEHVGYMASFTATQDMRVAVVPLGYDDGVKRGLSNNFCVKVRGEICRNVGKICMDCFMIDVSNVKAKIGDEVEVLWNASEWCDFLNTTEYEILTNFNGFRGERIIN